MYDESHIGNPEYSYDYICPNCGYDGSDKDGYCVKCGEYVRPERSKRHSKQKTTIPPLVKRILIVVGAGAAAFLMFFWGFCVGFDRRDTEYVAVQEFAEGQTLTRSSEEDKQMLRDLIEEYKSDALIEYEMQTLLIRYLEKYYSYLTFDSTVEQGTQEMQTNLDDTYSMHISSLDQLLAYALDDSYVLEDKSADRTDHFVTGIKELRRIWKEALGKYDTHFMQLLEN